MIPPDSESDDDMPSLESISTESHHAPNTVVRSEEHFTYQVLAQIEIASCFLSGPEPLFSLLSRQLWLRLRSRSSCVMRPGERTEVADALCQAGSGE